MNSETVRVVIIDDEAAIRNEVAEILGISVKAASNRYVRALQRLKELIQAIEKRGYSN